MRKENSTELPSEAWVVPTALDVTPTNLGGEKGLEEPVSHTGWAGNGLGDVL